MQARWHQLQYIINHNNIKIDDNPRYLGVILDSSLSWHKHIERVTKTANSKLQLLRRVASPFKGITTKHLIILYKVVLQTFH